MEDSVISVDSLGQSETDLLHDKLKQKDTIINEKSQIIDSLRQQIKDLIQDNEEMENSQQLLHQKFDRLTKELEQKNDDLESLAHTLKEIETAHEKLQKRMEARTIQVQKFAENLMKTEKELEESRIFNEELQHKNEKLSTELELAKSKQRSMKESREEENYQHVEYKPQVQKFSTTLRFPIADEIGEFMDSSSQLPATPKACQYHLHKQNRAPSTITKQEAVHEKEPVGVNVDIGLESSNLPRQEFKQTRQEYAYVRKEPIKYHKELTIEEEQAMRVARAQELARRNAKTKPLHQTSYALELDTFDDNFTEQEIKKGNIRPPRRLPPQPPVSNISRQSGPARRALANCSNTPPVVKRQVYKKAEAFIV